jgi:hypothetical protein
MSSWARVGVKCVCVDGAPRRGGSYSVLPVEGRQYVIAAIDQWDWPSESGVGLHLVGLNRMSDVPFNIDRFRPLISQADDVAMFTALVETMKPTERLDRLAELLDTTPS